MRKVNQKYLTDFQCFITFGHVPCGKDYRQEWRSDCRAYHFHCLLLLDPDIIRHVNMSGAFFYMTCVHQSHLSVNTPLN